MDKRLRFLPSSLCFSYALTIKMASEELVEDKMSLLFGAVERLRALGVSEQMQIVSFGDQSARKSSVLRALFSILFPTHASLCTWYPTRLTIERVSQGEPNEVTITVRIEAHGGRLQAYSEVSRTMNCAADMPRIMEEAAQAMRFDLGTGAEP